MQEANWINGNWIQGTGTPFVTRDPSTATALSEFGSSTTSDVDAAVQGARDAFSAWQREPAPARGRLLDCFARELELIRDELAQTMTREMGKVLRESVAEVDTAIASCRYMAGEGMRALGEVIPSRSAVRMIFTVREPVGVVACITPWNFPIALAAYKIVAALITGNCVVWKPAPNVTESARLFCVALERAGVPAGVVNLIGAAGADCGSHLVTHPGVDAVVFTGSTAVGKSIAESCAQSLTPVSLELGGKNAIVVLDDADLDLACDGIIQSGFATSGQRCTAASRVIVQRSVSQSLTSELVRRTAALRVGSGFDPEVDLGPISTSDQLARIDTLVSGALSTGAQLLHGGGHPDLSRGNEGYFFPPTLLGGVNAEDTIAQTEVFGPVVALIEVADFDEAVRINNCTDYGLSSAVFTSSLRFAHRAAREFKSGVVYVNSGTSAAEMGVPFGGVGASGNGHREVSIHSFDVMTELKSVYMNY